VTRAVRVPAGPAGWWEGSRDHEVRRAHDPWRLGSIGARSVRRDTRRETGLVDPSHAPATRALTGLARVVRQLMGARLAGVAVFFHASRS
jgi:hypothetical protein